MTMDHVPKQRIERLFSVPPWTPKGFTKECKCGQHINYLSKICPYCKEVQV